ncbi:Hypothetical predicted protein [Scomber scombrus]|uniref:Uncharacterized protein n=1 Tax=Scomber scombrus TaxID=13677 RepID=A0AAV1PDG3_SCOSC
MDTVSEEECPSSSEGAVTRPLARLPHLCGCRKPYRSFSDLDNERLSGASRELISAQRGKMEVEDRRQTARKSGAKIKEVEMGNANKVQCDVSRATEVGVRLPIEY